MAKRATGNSIPMSGISEKIIQYMEHVSGSRSIWKFVFQGTIFTLFKHFPTIAGTFLRPFIYSLILGGVGKGCLIERNVRFEVPSKMYMGNRVFIGENCWISTGSSEGELWLGNDVFIAHRCTLTGQGGKMIFGERVHISRNTYINGIGGVEIGRETLLGPNVVLVSGTHEFKRLDIPIRLQGNDKLKITIGEDSWLAANVSVMPGVSIGKGVVVGAGAVVTNDLPDYAIAVGVPAKVVGDRREKSKELE